MKRRSFNFIPQFTTWLVRIQSDYTFLGFQYIVSLFYNDIEILFKKFFKNTTLNPSRYLMKSRFSLIWVVQCVLGPKHRCAIFLYTPTQKCTDDAEYIAAMIAPLHDWALVCGQHPRLVGFDQVRPTSSLVCHSGPQLKALPFGYCRKRRSERSNSTFPSPGVCASPLDTILLWINTTLPEAIGRHTHSSRLLCFVVSHGEHKYFLLRLLCPLNISIRKKGEWETQNGEVLK